MKIDANRLRALVKAHGLTNTNLAAKAGLTRQALQSILRVNDVVEVRDRTVKGLVQALRLADESLLSPDPLAGYKKAVADENADLSFAGLGLTTTDPKSMDDVYVPVKVKSVPERKDDDCHPSTDEREDRPINKPEELRVDQCLALNRRVLIQGEPGSGKTTALRHSARAYSLGGGEGSKAVMSRLPLMVRLADFAKARERDRDITLLRFVVTSTLRDASPDYWFRVERDIESELNRGGCLVFLDGLDEVGSDESLVAVLSRFINEFGQNHFALTSRTIGLDPEPWQKLGFSMFAVTPWRKEDIGEFTRRWYNARPVIGKKQKKQLEQRAEELTTQIMSHPPLRAIASNPLMLTILAALHYANAALPRRRVDLYAKIVEVMLETWEANKRGTRPGDPLHGIILESREFGWLLGRLALQMQREDRTLRPRWWVNDCVQQFLREEMALEGNLVKEQSERVIQYLCERAGLLVERGDRMFGFGHRTFQEYFAARGLLLEADGGGDITGILRPYLFHPQWEEVVTYVAGSLSPPRATTLLRIIVDDSDPAGRFLRRGQRLALRCLVEGTTIGERSLLDQIFSDGEPIGRSSWLGISIGFIGLLNQLLVTRYEAEAHRMLSQIEDAARKGLSVSDYLVVYLSSHDPPSPPQEDSPGIVCRKCLGGRQVRLVWPAWKKRIEEPEAWFAEALKRVRSSKTDIGCRKVLISLLGEEADTNVEAKRILKEMLKRDPLPTIRAECAEALETVSTSPDVTKLLLDRLDKDRSELVRASCAVALHTVAPNEADVLARLEQLFTTGSAVMRAAVARGFARIDLDSPDRKNLLERVLATIKSSEEPPSVRRSCIWAVASFLGHDEIAAVVEKCLDDCDPGVRVTALHVFADAITEGQMEWTPSLVGKIESMLISIPDPCLHLYRDLATIVAMKEIHGGQRLERVLGDALAPFGDLIKIAFVFGSVARSEQIDASDIDLMIIGDVRLKDLAAALHTAEQTLGRTINPVLFSADKFRDQYREGNPLLLDVVRNKKIYLKGVRDELTDLVGERTPN